MKINEVIVEAVNQSTGTPNAEPAAQAQPQPQQQAQQPAQQKPSLWSRIKSGFQQGQQQRQLAQGVGAQANQNRIRAELNSFNQYLSQASFGQQITPELLQAAAKKFITRRYPDVDQEIAGLIPKITDINTADQVIAQAYNTMMANLTAGDEQPQPAAAAPKAAQAAPQKTPAGIEVPFSAGAGPRKTQTAVDPEQAQQQAMAQGISVVSNEPIILRNKAGKEFGLNDKGQWIHLSSGKIPAEAYQAFLSQQHDISLGLQK